MNLRLPFIPFRPFLKTLHVGHFPNGVAIADLNHDGYPDIVTSNVPIDSSTLSVLMGRGHGRFAKQMIFPVDANPMSVLIADFNHDGHPDLATVNMLGTSVSVLLGYGNGRFANRTDFPVGHLPNNMKIGDLNQDGNLDIAVVNSGNPVNGSISLLVGDGQGHFSIEPPFSVGPFPTDLVLADFNHDSYLDMAIVSAVGTISVYKGDGNGHFSEEPDSFKITGGSHRIKAADIDHDHHLDMIVANYNASSVSVFMGYGNGSFAPKSVFRTGRHPNDISICDLNRDGNIDILTANYARDISLLMGDGQGHFMRFDLLVGRRPYSLATADVNNDTYPDIVVTNYVHMGTASLVLSFAEQMGHTTAFNQEYDNHTLEAVDISLGQWEG